MLFVSAEGGDREDKSRVTDGQAHAFPGLTSAGVYWKARHGAARTRNGQAFIQKIKSQNQKAEITRVHFPFIIWNCCLLFHFACGILVSLSKSDIDTKLLFS